MEEMSIDDPLPTWSLRVQKHRVPEYQCVWRWKKGWFVLYPASPHGVARLEFFDGKEGAAAADRVGTKRLDKKIVRLADCVSVAPAPDCVPKEGLAAFRLETSERTYLFAAEPQETAEWMAKLCEAAFLVSGGWGGGMSLSWVRVSPGRWAHLGSSEFWVTVQKTEAAERCRLHGAYVLKASRDGLVLQDPHSRQPLYAWPYRLLRRYGRDKVMFSFEAGRRCESGPGNFTFETKQGNEIFCVVEAAIHEQKAQAEENRQSGGSLDSETSGLAPLQSAIASTLRLEGEGGPPERRGPRSALGATLSWATEGGEEKEGATQDPLPPQWPSTPPRSPLSGLPVPSPPPRSPLSGLAGAPPPSEEDSGNVYSEPLDAVRAPRHGPDPLYADPLDSRGQGGGQQQEAAELGRTGSLYERVGPAAGGCQGQRGAGGHIYDEPEGRAPRPAPAPIYDEAHLPCEAWRTQGLEHRAGYELPYRPGAGDYAVPAFHQNLGLKPSKPSPAPKPPRTHRKPPPVLDWAPQKNGSNNNNNNHHHHREEEEEEEEGEPIYSRVLKTSTAGPDPVGREQSVDQSRPASVYEDLGEI
ncbi:PREDICTED: LOW QUALITY PROTEIN: docking protein 1 [Gekko japonicus]|uniref:LOW QUALITY PROTEIN: docking protein 1 n=1 Tax=Gekko japonicus TaxID=146911 RepID=A0ABM1JZ54_GEKJA|nr:PREDICTED: LOW QUALITY PROTEIN: docking protein 1 [Gekko japonicus]